MLILSTKVVISQERSTNRVQRYTSMSEDTHHVHRYTIMSKDTHPDPKFFLQSYTSRFLRLATQISYYATMTGATMHAVTAEYPHSTLKVTPACSSHSGTVLYEICVASQEESGCVGGKIV